MAASSAHTDCCFPSHLPAGALLCPISLFLASQFSIPVENSCTEPKEQPHGVGWTGQSCPVVGGERGRDIRLPWQINIPRLLFPEGFINQGLFFFFSQFKLFKLNFTVQIKALLWGLLKLFICAAVNSSNMPWLQYFPLRSSFKKADQRNGEFYLPLYHIPIFMQIRETQAHSGR